MPDRVQGYNFLPTVHTDLKKRGVDNQIKIGVFVKMEMEIGEITTISTAMMITTMTANVH